VATILNSSRERTRFLRFAFVGVTGAVVDFGVMNLLARVFGFRLLAAGIISFICAIINNFLWNRFWTYPDSRTKPVVRQLAEFSVVSVMGLLIRVPVLALLEPLMFRLVTEMPVHLPPLDPRAISDNLTLAVAVVIVMFWNFFVNRYWTYGDVT
jgi:putative flippase GtrA